ncbi:hypothetical protein ABPG77_003235 [Micractinium sp. CCAP 211/92]
MGLRLWQAAALLVLAAMPGAMTGLDGTWLQEASPARLRPPVPAAVCKCAPDPILPNPACILCLCGTGAAASAALASSAMAMQPPKNVTACGLKNTTKTLIAYGTGAKSTCQCGPDPFLPKPKHPGYEWTLCKCPRKTIVPNTAIYSAWPAPQVKSPPQTQLRRCSGNYALCSSANCTIKFVGKASSTIPLAECGCILPTSSNGLSNNSLVDPTYILSAPLAALEERRCPQNTKRPGCGYLNATPVCKAIADNTIYGGQYDYISAFASSPDVGGFNKLCVRPGQGGFFAQCMTAGALSCRRPAKRAAAGPAAATSMHSMVGGHAVCMQCPPFARRQQATADACLAP